MGSVACTGKGEANGLVVHSCQPNGCGHGDSQQRFLVTCDCIQAGDAENQAIINQKLLYACRDGDLDKIAALLRDQAWVETRNPLVAKADAADAYQNCDLISQEPQECIEIGSSDSGPMCVGSTSGRANGLTPLMVVAKEGYPHATALLLEARADVRSQDEDGMRPLHFAAQAGCVECCELLLKAGARCEARDDLGREACALVPAEQRVSAKERREWAEIFERDRCPEQSSFRDRCPEGPPQGLRAGPGRGTAVQWA